MTPTCAECGGPCRGVTTACRLDDFLANPANAEFLALVGPGAVADVRRECPTCRRGAEWCVCYETFREDPGAPRRAPASAPRCECGSGSDDPSGAHSHWCPRWVS